MSFTTLLPFLSTLVMLIFTVWVLQRYVVRRKLHFLFWGLGLAMFGFGSFAEAYLAITWNKWVFFGWYLFGAALTAGWIGHGTVYLLFRKKWVHGVTAVLLLGSLFAAYLMFVATQNLNVAAFSPSVPISEQYRDIMPAIDAGGAVRLTTPFFNVYGLITLVGGALWSAYLFWRKRVLPNRVIGNVLIAAGALSIGFASTLTRLGNGSYLFLGELVAAVLMFIGFRFAAKPAPAVQNTTPVFQTGEAGD
ncbi:MAG: hypothetical protein H6667_21640 [Ardenticatenaceae bacterium]|nr:hypothetical protein [Ardenticatenaceae bacterium]